MHTASNSVSRGHGVSQLGKQCSFDYPEVKCINRRNTARRAKRRSGHRVAKLEFSFDDDEGKVFVSIRTRISSPKRGQADGECRVAAIKLQGGEGLVAVDHNRGGSGHRPVHSIAETGGEASYHS